MKNGLLKMVLVLTFTFTLVQPGFSIGDSRFRMKVSMDVMSPQKKVAVVAFTGNSVIVGNMGIGSLVTGALAKKKDNENKVALDQAYMGLIYDIFTKTLTNEGYDFIPVETVLKSNSYQEATTVDMPSFIDAKGLKQMNASKADSLQKLAAETGADLFFHVTSGHSLGMRSNIGTIMGKQVGIATAMVLVYDAKGKKLGFIDVSEVSNKAIGSVAGGFADPNQVMPVLEEADQLMISKLAAKISLKK